MKAYKSKKLKKEVALLLILTFVTSSFTITIAKADERKETIKETHKLTINNKDYVNTTTVEAILDIDTNLSLKANRDLGIPQLKWNEIEGATYLVKRGEVKDKLEVVAENITKNNFVDVNSTKEKQYFYSVTAKKDGKDLYTSSLVMVKAFIDSDKDGIADEQEAIYTTDPNNPDTDGDKLSDGLEVFSFHTNPLIKDTDEDRLTDYEEASIIGTSPLKKDTDGNGITDDLEDLDKDTINNYDEIMLGSNPKLDDTDFDKLKDGDEKTRGTKLDNADTDGDGLSDFKEVELGTNPLVKDTDNDGILDGDEIFKTKLSAQGVNLDEKAKPSLDLDLKGNQIESLNITKIDKNDSFLSSDIPGFIGSGYEFKVDGTFTSAKLTFEFDNALLTKAGFAPRIYYFNEKTQMLEELKNQTVVGNTVSVNLTHFSKYILLNKTEFDKVWEQEIKPPTQEGNQANSLDIALVLDSSGSMVDNDPNNIRLDVGKAFVDKLGDKDRATIVDFDDSVSLLSPFTSDKTLAKSAIDRIDSNGGTAIHLGVEKALNQFDTQARKSMKNMIVLTDGEDNYSYNYSALLKRAKDNNITVYTIGLGSIALYKVINGKKTIIVGMRGTEPKKDGWNDWSADIVGGLTPLTTQSMFAINEYLIINQIFNDADMYLAGHSLGGRLVQDVISTVFDAKIQKIDNGAASRLKNAATFNGLGYNALCYLFNIQQDIQVMWQNKLTNYYYNHDLVGGLLGNSGLFMRIGTQVSPWEAKDSNGNDILPWYTVGYSFSTVHGITLWHNDSKLKSSKIIN